MISGRREAAHTEACVHSVGVTRVPVQQFKPSQQGKCVLISSHCTFTLLPSVCIRLASVTTIFYAQSYFRLGDPFHLGWGTCMMHT